MRSTEFTYNHLGAEFTVMAIYTPDGEDWAVHEITMEAPDGHDYYTEAKEVFVREWASIKMKSLAELIEEKAWDRLGGM